LTDRPNLRPSGEPATARVAKWISHHRWSVAAGWFIATIGLFVVPALAAQSDD